MPQKAPIECPTCKQNITKTQFSIGCGICGIYYHVECVGVSEESLNSIRKNITKFICNECKKSDGGCGNFDLLKRMDEIQKSIENKIEVTRHDIERRMDDGFLKLDNKVNQFINKFRAEITNEIKEVKSDVKRCISTVQETEKSYEAKYRILQSKNNMLERRLNRTDILISGLTCAIDNVRENMIKIANLVGVVITNSDICHCCFLNRRKQFLIKFNSVQLRDVIMKNYFKSSPLLLNKIIGGTIESRVYLNDNLSPSSSKLQYFCRKLLSEKKIRKFYILNMDMPKAKIIQLNSKIVLWDAMQCAKFLEEPLEAVGHD